MSKVHRVLPPLDPNQRYSIDEALAYLRMGRRRGFDDIKSGKLVTFTEGKRRYVHGRELMRRSRPPKVSS